jgi:glutamate synthase domain-containing protein 2
MRKSNLRTSVRFVVTAFFVLLNMGILLLAGLHPGWYWALPFSLLMLLMVLRDLQQRRHAIIRNYPLLGRLRYALESIRPELRQYFFESDLDGRPFNRRQRSIVYQRAKDEKQTVAFGMQADPNAAGYEWISHSMFPLESLKDDLRVWIGNHQCLQPYQASILNIGAMSFGALSKTAITSLNEGAAMGGFAHNTGEGGISEYHLRGGDLIWQIGTGYFGCRGENGRFNEQAFRSNALRPAVKMIELKLSQGAKPGHGGILPAAKNTAEIAAIRGVEPGTTVHSPAAHSEFDSAEGLICFLQKLRMLSGGKPVGFKICIGEKTEFLEICRAIAGLGIYPDFITVDGAEGGTGAAPLEFTDHLGMPLYDALAFVKQALTEFKLTDHVRIIAAGKIITGFDILKAISLGASACYSARGMMMALGCIQALVCDSGRCPVGVATQDPARYQALHPSDKRVRVFNFHRKTIEATRELMAACGFRSTAEVRPARMFRRLGADRVVSFEQLYFPVQEKNEFINALN